MVERNVRSGGNDRIDAISGKRSNSAHTKLTVSAFSTIDLGLTTLTCSTSHQTPLHPEKTHRRGLVLTTWLPGLLAGVSETTRVPVRKMPGAIALGLLASLFTHAVLFGNGHSVGGTLHEVLLQGVAATAVALVVAWVALAWSGRHVADGSVLGARLSARLPGWPSVATCAAAWYALIEHAEASHAGPGAAMAIAALIAAAAIVCLFAKALVRSIALAIVAVATSRFCPRIVPVCRPSRRIIRPSAPALRRRYARPPPIASLCA
jgi:hypothetical protein